MGTKMSTVTSESGGGIIFAGVIVLAALTTAASAFRSPRREAVRSPLMPNGDATRKTDISQVDLKLDANAAGFSLQNAYSLATLSTIAYKTKPEAQKIIQGEKKDGGLGYDHFHWFELDPIVSNEPQGSVKLEDTEAFVAADNDVIVVTFRGTSERSDWATNFDFIPVPPPASWKVENGEMHKGYSEGINTVWETHGMINAIRTLYNEPEKNRKLFLAGHSLGGALATVAAARLVFEEDMHVAGMYTIGSPRVFNAAMAKHFDERVNGGKPMKSKYFRARNNNDIVTRVPPRPLYEHVGTEVYFDRYGVINTSNILDRTLGRLDALMRLEVTDGINDHSGDRYVELFRRALMGSRLSILEKSTDIVATGLEKVALTMTKTLSRST